jgi:hypothetical protein
MAKEEVLINKALWEHYTDEQLIALSQKIAASVPPDEAAIAFKWMLRGINNNEAVNWLISVKQNALVQAFESLINLAEKELPEERFSMIQELINEDVVMA